MKEKLNKFVKGRGFDYLVVVLYLLIGVVMFRGVLMESGVVGLRHDWSVPQTADQIKLWHDQALYAWISARGGFTISYLSDYLIRLSVGLLGWVGMNGDLLSKLYLVVCSWMTGVFSYVFLRQVTRNKTAALVGSLFYTINPLTFNKYIAGHINYWIGYALSPLFGWAVYRNILADNGLKSIRFWWWTVLAGVIFAITGVQLQFLIMLSMVYVVMAVVYKAKIIRALVSYVVIGLVATLIHLPWLMVLFWEMMNYKSGLANSPTTLSGMMDNASYVYQALIMTGNNSDYFMNSLLTNNLLTFWVMGMVGVILAVLVVVYQKRSRVMWGLFGFWLLGVLMLSFYRLFPGFSFVLLNSSQVFNFFREVYHLTFFTVFLWSMLLAICWDDISFESIRQRIVKYLLVIALCVFVLPGLVDGKLLNNLQVYNVSTNELENETGSMSWFWPGIQPFEIDNDIYAGFDSSVYYAEGGALSQMGRYSPLNERYATFLNAMVYFDAKKMQSVLPQILDQNFVDRIIYRHDVSSWLDKFTLMSRYPEKVKIWTNESLNWLEDNYSQNKNVISEKVDAYVFDTPKKITEVSPCYITGEWEDMLDVAQLGGPAKCDLMIESDKVGVDQLKDLKMPVILNDNNWLDLMLGDDRVKKMEAGAYANQEFDMEKGWVSGERAWWYDPQIVSYSGLPALTHKNGAVLELDMGEFADGEYRVWMEVLSGAQGGSLEINYRDLQFTFSTRQLNQNWQWHDLGKVYLDKTDPKFKIASIDGFNAVGMVIIVKADDFDSVYAKTAKYLANQDKIVLSDVEQISEPAMYDFDFTKDGVYYENFPEYSGYQFVPLEASLSVLAKFGGSAEQNEFATIIYDLHDYDLRQMPVMTMYAEVENEEIGFWEMGLEIDQDNDKQSDFQLWLKLDNGFNTKSVADFFAVNNLKYDQEKYDVIAMRLQPHKQYGVDMGKYSDREYVFKLSQLKFATTNNEVIRLPRMQVNYDLNKLKQNAILSQDLSKNATLYNDFAQNQQDVVAQESQKLVIKSRFNGENKKSEFATVIVDTNVNIMDLPYLTIDLEVTDDSWQFYDMALMIDSDFDNYIDQEIWLDSVWFDDGLSITVFVDVQYQLMQKMDNFYEPRLLGIKILPHRQYEVSGETHDVFFTIGNINYYHDGALNLAEKVNLPVLRSTVNVPQTGSYDMYIKKDEESIGNLQVLVGEKQIEVRCEKSPDWVRLGVVDMVQGNNEILWLNTGRTIKIDKIVLFKTGDDFGKIDGGVQVEEYEKINPGKYVGKLKVDSTDLVLFKESYHPAWKMDLINRDTGELVASYNPIMVNGWQQGYLIDEVGDFDFVISYELNGLYRMLLWIVGVIGVGMLGWLLVVGKYQGSSFNIQYPSEGNIQ